MNSKQRRQRERTDNAAVRGVGNILGVLTGRGRLPIVVAILLALVGGGLYFAWQAFAPSIVSRGEYRVPAERIRVTMPPAWLTANVADEVVRDGSLDTGLSILDNDLVTRVIDAFEIHPWVQSVDRVEKQLPAGLAVDVTYREPVAAVVVAGGEGNTLSPVDADGVRLPADGIQPIALQRLPRIGKTSGPPPIGQTWRNERVLGACRLAKFLSDDWKSMCLVDILPSERSHTYEETTYFVYQLVTKGRTHIIWGAAPGSGPPDESPPEQKLARLQKAIAKLGSLTGVNSSKEVDIRYGMEFKVRSAKKGTPPARDLPTR